MENGYAERPTGRINSGSLNLVPEFYGRRSESAECWLKTLGRLASPSVYHWDENTMLEVAMLKMRDEAAIWLNSLNPNLCWREFERLFLVRFVEPIEEAMSRLTHCKQGHKEGIQSYTDRFKSDARAAGRTEDLALLHQYLDNMRQDLKIEVYRKGMDTLRTIDCVAGFLRSWEIVSMADNYNQYPQSRPVRPPMGYDSNRGRVNDNRGNNGAQHSGYYNGRQQNGFGSVPPRGRDFNGDSRWNANSGNFNAARTGNGGNWNPRPAVNTGGNRPNAMAPQGYQQASAATTVRAPETPGKGGTSLDDLTRQLEQLKLHLAEGRSTPNAPPAFHVYEECADQRDTLLADGDMSSDPLAKAKALFDDLIVLAQSKRYDQSEKYVPPPRRANSNVTRGNAAADYPLTPYFVVPPGEVQLMDYVSDKSESEPDYEYAYQTEEPEIYVKRPSEDNDPASVRMPRKRVAFDTTTKGGMETKYCACEYQQWCQPEATRSGQTQGGA